jgi:hypothetical protein
MIEVDFSPIHAIAHTFFTFTFRNASTISVSVESRREVGEDYTPTKGMFRTYELIYIWGSETDNIARRIIWQKDPTSMYPIRIDNATLQALFLRLVVDTNDLVEHPRFYNSLFSTCTSNLLDAARGVSKKRLPWTVARFLPGYSAGYLHKNNLIITNVTEDLLAGHFRINNATTSTLTFSQDIRSYLASK